jgi:predicted nucleic acid-binding protein
MSGAAEDLVAVVNSTPLIALSIVGHFHLLPQLFEHILIPAAVYNEVVNEGRGRPGSAEARQADWLEVRAPKETTPLPAELMGLDQGEIDVILLAKEVEADWVLIDEKLGRQIR